MLNFNVWWQHVPDLTWLFLQFHFRITASASEETNLSEVLIWNVSADSHCNIGKPPQTFHIARVLFSLLIQASRAVTGNIRFQRPAFEAVSPLSASIRGCLLIRWWFLCIPWSYHKNKKIYEKLLWAKKPRLVLESEARLGVPEWPWLGHPYATARIWSSLPSTPYLASSA